MKNAAVLFFVCCWTVCLCHAQRADFAHRDFSKADSIAAKYAKHSLENLPMLAWKLTQALPTEEEKFRALYRWVCDNIANDYTLLRRNQRQRRKARDPQQLKEWNDKFLPVFYKNLVHHHRTVCTGYAYLIRELAGHVGIEAVIVDGYGRTIQDNIGGNGIANHSWNAVRLNDKWYLCDATWASGAIHQPEGRFVKHYNDVYFLASPDLFIRNHYPLDVRWTLLPANPKLKEYFDGPITYTTIYDYNITAISPATFDIYVAKDVSVRFQIDMKNEGDGPAFALQVQRGTNVYPVVLEARKNENGVYEFEHAFTAIGRYIAHVTLNNKIAYTYRVHVHK